MNTLLGSVTATATCPAGTVLLGGGYRIGGLVTLQVLDNSRDATNTNQWNVTAFGALGDTITAVAECAP
ncbi:hypothetical protein G3I60_30920 [Streptomyces sp. SID13666]|uniref:hypothetical protein n=1 Tax=Streptomyces TaxID=1883 RepID=UPI0013C1FAD3|nr:MULTISPECIES: hypothetical protein [Streptomyces]MCM2420518.1 hypothetical protein [Streptomyces sp. RKAG293]MCZ4094903.1 hypothetical protein [Streptomyces sp. H39-C1]NEA58445.1 hypothetical protein [Streptomyces sp. SID13666]